MKSKIRWLLFNFTGIRFLYEKIVSPKVTHLNVHSSISEGQSKYYNIDLPAGYAIKILISSTNDVDLYLRPNQLPTTSQYLVRAWTTSGNESINYMSQSNETLHIMVYGYQASDSFTLRTIKQ